MILYSGAWVSYEFFGPGLTAASYNATLSMQHLRRRHYNT
jgi:hypothetical protein